MLRVAGMVSTLAACSYPALPSIGDASHDASPPFVNPHCATLAPSCGASGNNDCCASPFVPGGSYYRSYDLASDGKFSKMAYPATISDFRLDKYEVTVGRFRQFVEAGYGTQYKPPAAGSGAHPHLANSGWDAAWNNNLAADSPTLVSDLKCGAQYQTWTDAPGPNENLPITCLTWFDAMAFCIWDGGYLPTEAEWNYAAAGGSEQRAYPWSPAADAGNTTIDCTYANYSPDPNNNVHCVGTVNNVGSESPKGDGRWGHADLAGNSTEAVLDWYQNPYPPGPCDDCANLTTADFRTYRGGGFAFDASMQRSGAHAGMDTLATGRGWGVRCARNL